MAKTRRDLFNAIADMIGGERGQRMRDAIEKCGHREMMDRPMTDEEYAVWIDRANRDLPKIIAGMDLMESGDPGTWGMSN